MTNIKTKFADFVKESVFEDLPDESSDITINLDTITEIDGEGNPIVHDPDIDGTQLVIDALHDNNIEYTIFDEPGGANQIEMTGSVESIKQVLQFWDAHGRNNDDLQIALQDWDGDEEELWEIIA